MWRIFEFENNGTLICVMASRQLSDDEVEQVFQKGRFEVDYSNFGIDFCYGTNIVKACYSYKTRELAREAYKKWGVDNG